MALVDLEQWPLVAVNWPAGLPTDAQVEDILRVLSSCYGRRHAVLQNGLRITAMTRQQRRRMMEHTNLYDDEVRRWVVASAGVVQSALWRGIIAIIQRAAPPPCPFRTFGTLEEAREW